MPNRTIVFSITCLIILGSVIRPQSASTSESRLSISAGADAYSKYVWRGQLLNDEEVFQPSLDIGLAGFNLNLWRSMDITDIHENNDERFRAQEMDYTLSYETALTSDLTVSGGMIFYNFPGTGVDGTQEIFASASWSTLVGDLGLSSFIDIDEAKAYYLTLSFGKEFELRKDLSLSIGASLAWQDEDYNTFYFGYADSSLGDLTFSMSLDYGLSEKVSVSLKGGYAIFPDSDLRRAAEMTYGDNRNAYVGLGLSVSF
ncbi:MAG: hypothetical protein D6820_10295 [Lentisphaerae bacterium]|nr:MAG: hypothetical protein D6820_10295 [Lentisphaerota bacterium]